MQSRKKELRDRQQFEYPTIKTAALNVESKKLQDEFISHYKAYEPLVENCKGAMKEAQKYVALGQDPDPDLKKRIVKIKEELNKFFTKFKEIEQHCSRIVSNPFFTPEKNLYIYWGIKSCSFLADYYCSDSINDLKQALVWMLKSQSYQEYVQKDLNPAESNSQILIPIYEALGSSKFAIARICGELADKGQDAEENRIAQEQALRELDSENYPVATLELSGFYERADKLIASYYYFWKAFFGFYKRQINSPINYTAIPKVFFKNAGSWGEYFSSLRELEENEHRKLNFKEQDKKIKENRLRVEEQLLRLNMAILSQDSKIIRNEVSFFIQCFAAKIQEQDKDFRPQIIVILQYIKSIIDKLPKELLSMMGACFTGMIENFYGVMLKWQQDVPAFFIAPTHVEMTTYYFIIQDEILKKTASQRKALPFGFAYVSYFYLTKTTNNVHINNSYIELIRYATMAFLTKEPLMLSLPDLDYFNMARRLAEIVTLKKKNDELSLKVEDKLQQLVSLYYLMAFLFGQKEGVTALKQFCYLQGNNISACKNLFSEFNVCDEPKKLVAHLQPVISILTSTDHLLAIQIKYAWTWFLINQPYHRNYSKPIESLKEAQSLYHFLINVFKKAGGATENIIMDCYYRHSQTKLEEELTALNMALAKYPQPQKQAPVPLAVSKKPKKKPKPQPQKISTIPSNEVIPKPRKKRKKKKVVSHASCSQDKTQNTDMALPSQQPVLPQPSLTLTIPVLSSDKVSNTETLDLRHHRLQLGGLQPADLSAYGFKPIEHHPAALEVFFKLADGEHRCFIIGSETWSHFLKPKYPCDPSLKFTHDFDFWTTMPREEVIKRMGLQPENKHRQESLCTFYRYLGEYKVDINCSSLLPKPDFPARGVISDTQHIYDLTGQGLAALRDREVSTCLPTMAQVKVDPFCLLTSVKLLAAFNKQLKMKIDWYEYAQLLLQENVSLLVKKLGALLINTPSHSLINVLIRTGLLKYLFPEISRERYTIFCLKEQLTFVQKYLQTTPPFDADQSRDYAKRCGYIFLPVLVACFSTQLVFYKKVDTHALVNYFIKLIEQNKLFAELYPSLCKDQLFYKCLINMLRDRLVKQLETYVHLSQNNNEFAPSTLSSDGCKNGLIKQGLFAKSTSPHASSAENDKKSEGHTFFATSQSRQFYRKKREQRIVHRSLAQNKQSATLQTVQGDIQNAWYRSDTICRPK